MARIDPRNVTRYWWDRHLPGLSLLHADFTTHEYPPHTHEALVVAVTEQGGSIDDWIAALSDGTNDLEAPARRVEPLIGEVLSALDGAKGVRLSRGALAANAGAIAQFLGLRADDRGVLHLPLHYSYGLSVLNSHLAVGASLHVTGASILDAGFLEALRDRRCTNFPGVPHSFELLESVGFRDGSFPDLRFMTVAGGTRVLPVSLDEARQRVRAAWPAGG